MILKKNLNDIVEILVEPTVNVASSLLFEGILSQIIPGATTTIMSYKQKRLEKMIEKFISELKNRQDEIEEKLSKLDVDKIDAIREIYFPIVIDHVIDNNQEEKIEIIVNGFVNIISSELIDENIISNYFEALKNINVLDIKVLNEFRNKYTCKSPEEIDKNILYSQTSTFMFDELVKKISVDKAQLSYVLTKLEKNNLIENTEFYAYNKLVKQVSNLTKNGYNNGNRYHDDLPYDWEMPPYYILTSFGVDFVKFFYNRK